MTANARRGLHARAVSSRRKTGRRGYRRGLTTSTATVAVRPAEIVSEVVPAATGLNLIAAVRLSDSTPTNLRSWLRAVYCRSTSCTVRARLTVGLRSPEPWRALRDSG